MPNNKNSKNRANRNKANRCIATRQHRFARKAIIKGSACKNQFTMQNDTLMDLSVPIDFMYNNNQDLYLILDHEQNIATIFDITCFKNECEYPPEPLQIIKIIAISSEWAEVLEDCQFTYLDKCTGEIIEDKRGNYCNGHKKTHEFPKATCLHVRELLDSEYMNLVAVVGNIEVQKPNFKI